MWTSAVCFWTIDLCLESLFIAGCLYWFLSGSVCLGRGHRGESLGQSVLVPGTQLLKCLAFPQRQEHLSYTSEMTSGRWVLDSFRMVTGHQDNQGIIRR